MCSPPRGVIPGQHLVLGAVAVDTYHSGESVGAIASSQRSMRKHSDHSWKVPPRRHTSSMTGARRRSPPLAMPLGEGGAGSCHFIWDAVVASNGVAQRVDLALQLHLRVLPEPLERGKPWA